jgi:hypothetical protein
MLKYKIIACIVGWFTIYALWGVLRLGWGALFGDTPDERRYALSFCILWLGVLIVSAIFTAGAVSRIITLRKRARERKVKHDAV